MDLGKTIPGIPGTPFYKFKHSKQKNKKYIYIAILQKAALSTSHWLPRCQVVLTKIIVLVLSEIEIC